MTARALEFLFSCGQLQLPPILQFWRSAKYDLGGLNLFMKWVYLFS